MDREAGSKEGVWFPPRTNGGVAACTQGNIRAKRSWYQAAVACRGLSIGWRTSQMVGETSVSRRSLERREWRPPPWGSQNIAGVTERVDRMSGPEGDIRAFRLSVLPPQA